MWTARQKVCGMGDPLVSVVMPAYNVAEYIGHAIESVLAQTFRNWELIVVDDGSLDGTGDVCREHGDRIIYRRRQNSGVARARNEGVRLARGELVAMLDADDYWYPQKLAKQVETLGRHEEADFVCTNYRYLYNGEESCETAFEGNELVRELAGRHGGDSITLARSDFPRFFLSPFGHTTTSVFRKALFLEVGGYDERFSVAEDMHLWFRYLARCRSLIALRSPLAVYRIRQGSSTRNPDARGNEQTTLVYEDLLRTLGPRHPDLVPALRYRVRTARLDWVYELLRDRRRADALREGVKALGFGWDWRVVRTLAGAVVR
jgi:glycosyltransferase involved in cell wall biosynthesis